MVEPGTEIDSRGTLLVTGGSRGIGAAIATLAARRGYQVAINFRERSQAAESLCAQITRDGGVAFTVQADVSDEHSVQRLFCECDRRGSYLSVLVNNAGVVDQTLRFEEYSAARVRRLLDINVLSAVLCSQEAVRRMSTRFGGQGGAIVNISSIAAVLGAPGEYIDYAATKAAVDTLTVGLSREVAAEGIRVNAVRPGIIDTEIHGSGGQPDRVARLAPGLPMQRAGTSIEVAYAVLWLASDEASYVSGSILNVAGGR